MTHNNPRGSVLVLTSNPDTQMTLRESFAETGVLCQPCGTLNPLSRLPDGLRAIVVFADDFREAEVNAYLAVQRARRSLLPLVVITRSPATYEAMRGMDGRPLGVEVLARPTSGWTILDMLRDAHVQP